MAVWSEEQASPRSAQFPIPAPPCATYKVAVEFAEALVSAIKVNELKRAIASATLTHVKDALFQRTNM
jgi:hypothetical protein